MLLCSDGPPPNRCPLRVASRAAPTNWWMAATPSGRAESSPSYTSSSPNRVSLGVSSVQGHCHGLRVFVLMQCESIGVFKQGQYQCFGVCSKRGHCHGLKGLLFNAV